MKLVNKIAIFSIASTLGLIATFNTAVLARGGGGGGGHYAGGGTSTGFSGSGWSTGGGAIGRGFSGYGGYGGYGYGGWGGYGGYGYGALGGSYSSWGPSAAYEAEQAQMSNPNRPSAFSRAYGGDATLSTAVDQTWNGGGSQTLAMDGAFGRAASNASISATQGHYTAASPGRVLVSLGSTVRDNFKAKDLFMKSWFSSHKAAWQNPMWSDGWAWQNTDWTTLASWWGLPVVNAPTDYEYGSNILYMNGQVYYGSQPVGTSAQYYNQALALAESQPTASISQPWKPLGIFALVGPNTSTPSAEFQLSVDKNGAIRGTYVDALSSQVKPVQGAVDRNSWRACWVVGTDKQVVYDTGLSNILQAQDGVLVHFNKDHTQQMALIRLAK